MKSRLCSQGLFVSVLGIGNAGVVSAWSSALTTQDKSASALALLAVTKASASSSSVAPSESRVTLGALPDPAVVYRRPSRFSLGVAWASPPTDPVSVLMQKNLRAGVTDDSAWLKGLGAAVLNRLATSPSGFSQTVASYPQDNAQSADAARVSSQQALASASAAANRVGLTITTASGKTVNIAVSFASGGLGGASSLAVDVQVDGDLSADEQKAVVQLSAGFQAALDGLAKVPPEVNLSGLVGYDASVLAGVDLNIRARPPLNGELESFAFHADATQRSFSMDGVGGKMALSVDLSQPEIRGSAAQQKAALSDYLAQFDAANRRGHGNAKLIAQFKDAFVQLNSNYPAADKRSIPLLNGKDRSLLSGLADFSASMSGDFTDAAEGHVMTEAGHLEYRAAQSTTISGRDKYSGLAVKQTQRASLKSDFVKSRNGTELDTSTGNYDRYSIRDESSTTTSFAYAKDKVQSASIKRLVNQLENYAKLVDFKVVEERQTPRHEATLQDVSAQLLPSYKDAMAPA